MSNETIYSVAMYNAKVTARLQAEQPEMKEARYTMGEVSKMEHEYGKLEARLKQLAGTLTRRVACLKTQLDDLATRHPEEAAQNTWIGWWRSIGCPHYAEHGRP